MRATVVSVSGLGVGDLPLRLGSRKTLRDFGGAAPNADFPRRQVDVTHPQGSQLADPQRRVDGERDHRLPPLVDR